MKYIYIAFILFLFSCSAQKEKEVEIRHIEVPSMLISDFVGLPIQLLASDSLFFINDFYGDTLVHCYSLPNGEPISKIGVKGDGPNEILSPVHLFVKKDSLYMFSRLQWTLYNAFRITDRKVMNVPQEVSLLFPLTDSTFIASGMYSENRLAILNSQGEIDFYFGNYPSFWAKEKELSINVKRMFHQVRGLDYIAEKGLAIVTSHVLSIYSQCENAPVFGLKKEFLLAPYKYKYKESGISSQAKLRHGFIIGAKGLVALNSKIYVLMNVNKKGEESHQKNEIWEFDWDGNLTAKYIPDMNVSHMAKISETKIALLSEKEQLQFAVWEQTSE